MVSLPRHAGVTGCIGTSGGFTISVLSAGQSHIARQYGGKSQSDPQDIEPAELNFSQWNIPVVKGARAQLLCEVRHSHGIKDQVVIIAEISDFMLSDHLEPLVYIHRCYFSG